MLGAHPPPRDARTRHQVLSSPKELDAVTFTQMGTTSVAFDHGEGEPRLWEGTSGPGATGSRVGAEQGDPGQEPQSSCRLLCRGAPGQSSGQIWTVSAQTRSLSREGYLFAGDLTKKPTHWGTTPGLARGIALSLGEQRNPRLTRTEAPVD